MAWGRKPVLGALGSFPRARCQAHSAGPNPCERREEQGPCPARKNCQMLRKWFLVLAPLTEVFCEDVQF